MLAHRLRLRLASADLLLGSNNERAKQRKQDAHADKDVIIRTVTSKPHAVAVDNMGPKSVKQFAGTSRGSH